MTADDCFRVTSLESAVKVNTSPLVAGNRRGQSSHMPRFDEAGSLFCGDRFTTHL